MVFEGGWDRPDHHLQDPHQVLQMGTKPCSHWPSTGYGSRGQAIYFSSLYLSSLPGGMWYLSSEQSEGSLIYPKGTNSSSIILICSVIFFLFPSFVGSLSFFYLFHFFLSKTTQMLPSQEVHLISSPSLWENRLSEGIGFTCNIRSSLMVRKYSAMYSQFSCQVFLLACLGLFSENKVHLFRAFLLGSSAYNHKVSFDAWKGSHWMKKLHRTP